MSTMTASGPKLRDCLDRLSRSAPSPSRARRRRSRPYSSRPPARPVIEWLEDYLLLSATSPATIAGTVQLDPGGGAPAQGAPGVPGETVFLDLGHNHQAQSTATFSNTSPALVPAPGALTNILGPASMSSLSVQGLQPDISNLTVSMDLANNGTNTVAVALISPVGLTVPNLPTLFQIDPGEHFSGTFDLNATTSITEATGSSLTGTYVPQQFFSDPQAHMVGTDPNGNWGLILVGSKTDVSKLDLKSWSLTITTPDPTAVTDSAGNYAFHGVAPGTYQVGVLPSPGDVQTFPASGGERPVTVAAGQTVGGINFGVLPASNLSTTSFYLSSPATSWGQSITVNYTITNNGNGNAPAFDVALLLSNNGRIADSDTPLQTLHIDALAAHATTTGSLTSTLPSAPPTGFGATSQAIVGFLIDPSHKLPDNVATHDANQGLGVDESSLAVAPNQPVTTGSGVQQDPSIAVDPMNADHLVVAYMDSTLVTTTGYAGIGVSTSTDGGATWQRTSIPLPAGFSQGAAAPTILFDGRGNLFVAFMAVTYFGALPNQTYPSSSQRVDGFASNNGIFVARSTDGGLTWGQPAAVASHVYTGTDVPFDSGPTLAIDTYKTLPNGQANPRSGDVYVAWTRVYPAGQFPGDPKSTDGSDVMFSVSADAGLTWQTQTQDQDGVQVTVIRDPIYGTNDKGANPASGFAFYPQISVGPEGDIYVSMYDAGYFGVFLSTDGGASFVPPNLSTGQGVPFYNPVLPGATLFPDSLRTLSSRDIVADPSHPGRVYVVEADVYFVYQNNLYGLYSPLIVFAYSNDYGQTWKDRFQVGNETTNLDSLAPGFNDSFLATLNDANLGNFSPFDSDQQLAQEVLNNVALPSLAVNAQGQVTVIWYDSRRDPLGVGLDVFGTVSNDGGLTFSPNFRVSDTTFDPNAGAFTGPNGTPDYYFGDKTGLAAVNGVAYAVWTETRNGSQDIYLQKYSLNLPLSAPLDRFYPNGTRSTATDLGPIAAQQVVPLLRTGPGDDNWYKLQAVATGELDVVATVTSGDASQFQIQLTDADGDVLPAKVTSVLDASGALIGVQLDYSSNAGQTYLVHISGGTSTIGYSLVLQSLTGDLGTSVEGSAGGSLTAGGQALYRYEAAVAGSLSVTLTPGADVTRGYDLRLVSWGDGSGVATTGKSLVIAGTDSNGLLHIRVFDSSRIRTDTYEVTESGVAHLVSANASGKILTDVPESKLTTAQAQAIANLKQQLPGLLPPNVLTDSGKDMVFSEATSITGHVFTGALTLTILGADGQTVLNAGPAAGTGAGVPQTITVTVSQGQVLLIQVAGAGSEDKGSFTFTYENFDQDETPGNASIFYPTASDPASVRVADLGNNGLPDILVSTVATSDTLQVLAGNADGTFQAPQQSDVGPGLAGGFLNAGYRQIGIADLDGNGTPDVIVPNFRAGDISVLLGSGAGGFLPQRNDDAVSSPDSLATGNFVTGSKAADIAVLQNFPQGNGTSKLAILIGRGDGTFLPAVLYPTVFTQGAGPMVVGDFDGDGNQDIIVFSKNDPEGEMFLGNGNGTFQAGKVFAVGEDTFAAEAVDLNDNGTLDLITTGTNGGSVFVQMGNGDGTFGPPIPYTVQKPGAGQNIGVLGLAVVGFKSTVSGSPQPTGAEVAGTPGIYATAQNRSGGGIGALYFLPAEFDAQGHFNGFGAARFQASLTQAGKIVAFYSHGQTDVVAADTGGVRVLYGVPLPQAGSSGGPGLTIPSNTTIATARDLGGAAHIVTEPEAILSGFADAYFTYHVPTEAVPGSGPEVIDLSAMFRDVGGAGLGMMVLDAQGHVIDVGDRMRIVAPQGSTLTIHIFAQPGRGGLARGSGVYTLDIDVLPQVASVKAVTPVPGGPATFITLTFQGEELDPTAAANPANYRVIYLGPGPGAGTTVPIGPGSGDTPIVYDPGVNIVPTSGLAYPTAVDQTVTLLFAQPLAPGSYEIVLSPAIQSRAFNAAESGVLAPGDGSFAGHPVVGVSGTAVVDGADLKMADLVTSGSTLGSGVVASWYLNVLQANLNAVIEQGLRASESFADITSAVNDWVTNCYGPLYLSPGGAALPQGIPSFAVIWFDPVSIDLQSPQGVNLSYNLSSNALSNGLGSSFVSVGGNVEMIVMENAAGNFNLDVGNVAASAQGGAVELTSAGINVQEFTSGLQSGATSFQLALGGETGGPSSGTGGGVSGPAGGTSGGPGPGSSGGGGAASAFAELASAGGTFAAALAGPLNFFQNAASVFETLTTTATTVVAAPTGANAAGQPNNPNNQGNDGSSEAQAAEERTLLSVDSIIEAVEEVITGVSGVMDALGRKTPAMMLRGIGGLIQKLRGPLKLVPAKDVGALPRSARGGAPAPEPDAGPVGIDINVWDHGLDGWLADGIPARRARVRSAAAALGASAFLASGLVGSELDRRRPARRRLSRILPEKNGEPS